MANVEKLEKRKDNGFDLFYIFHIPKKGFDLSVPTIGFSVFQ